MRDLASIQQHGRKKGASLYTLKNIGKYPELRKFTNRFLNKIHSIGGNVFYVGIEKSSPQESHDPNALYVSILREAIKRLNQYCEEDCPEGSSFLLVLDEHDQREALITAACQAMYKTDDPRRRLIEPPFQVESERYQTLQAADWLAGLIGRIAAIWARPHEYDDWVPIRRYFETRLHRVSRRSGVRIGIGANFKDMATEDIIATLNHHPARRL